MERMVMVMVMVMVMLELDGFEWCHRARESRVLNESDHCVYCVTPLGND